MMYAICPYTLSFCCSYGPCDPDVLALMAGVCVRLLLVLLLSQLASKLYLGPKSELTRDIAFYAELVNLLS